MILSRVPISVRATGQGNELPRDYSSMLVMTLFCKLLVDLSYMCIFQPYRSTIVSQWNQASTRLKNARLLRWLPKRLLHNVGWRCTDKTNGLMLLFKVKTINTVFNCFIAYATFQRFLFACSWIPCLSRLWTLDLVKQKTINRRYWLVCSHSLW